jgi:hypothetical protein
MRRVPGVLTAVLDVLFKNEHSRCYFEGAYDQTFVKCQ